MLKTDCKEAFFNSIMERLMLLSRFLATQLLVSSVVESNNKGTWPHVQHLTMSPLCECGFVFELIWTRKCSSIRTNKPTMPSGLNPPHPTSIIWLAWPSSTCWKLTLSTFLRQCLAFHPGAFLCKIIHCFAYLIDPGNATKKGDFSRKSI